MEFMDFWLREVEDETFMKLEKVLGTHWSVEDVMGVLEGGKSSDSTGKSTPLKEARLPLSVGVNPALWNMLKEMFGRTKKSKYPVKEGERNKRIKDWMPADEIEENDIHEMADLSKEEFKAMINQALGANLTVKTGPDTKKPQ